MKTVFAFLIAVAAGCSDHQNDNAEKLHRSHAQASLENLVDSFKTIFTLFHTKENLTFRSSMEFQKPMPPGRLTCTGSCKV